MIDPIDPEYVERFTHVGGRSLLAGMSKQFEAHLAGAVVDPIELAGRVIDFGGIEADANDPVVIGRRGLEDVFGGGPISNVKLAGVDKMANHPLKTMLDKGLAVTVNSDDPAYFGGYINDNYRAVQKSLNLSIEDLHRLARTSFTGSFLSEDAKAAHLAELDAYVAGFK